MRKHFAIVYSTGDGPAFGVGTTEMAAWRDARRWIPKGEPLNDLKAVEITADAYRRIRGGNPDAVERAD